MTTEIKDKFSMTELGNPILKESFIKMVSDAPKGGIIHVKAYESKGGHGEVADYFYLKGVSYAKMKERSLIKLEEIEQNENFSIKVTRGVWTDKNGVNHTRKAKDRSFRTISETYRSGDEALTEAIASIRNSILNPRKSSVDYSKEGNGVYSMESGALFIRDCQLLHKVIKREGDYPIKATGAKVAIQNAIKKNLPIGKYRQVKLDGRFDYISVGGQILMQDEAGENVYVGFVEHKDLLEPRIMGLEESLPSVKVPIKTLVNEIEVDDEISISVEDIFGG